LQGIDFVVSQKPYAQISQVAGSGKDEFRWWSCKLMNKMITRLPNECHQGFSNQGHGTLRFIGFKNTTAARSIPKNEWICELPIENMEQAKLV
jgi:hypothetical protein